MCDDCGTRVRLDTGTVTVSAPQELDPIVIKPARTSAGLGGQLVDWDKALDAGADPGRTMKEYREVLRRAADGYREKKRGRPAYEEQRKKAFAMFDVRHAAGLPTSDRDFKRTVGDKAEADPPRVNFLRREWMKKHGYRRA